MAHYRAKLLLTHWAGLRVGEAAALKIGDLVDTDTPNQEEMRPLPH